jgi:IrrE N-terminal-like domain
MALRLDRMALDDVGANPARLAAAIHDQLGEGAGAVPVYDIAKALDIVEICFRPLPNIEGALITTPERDIGSILVNSSSNKQRQRFTTGHELLHFLSPIHHPTSPDGFRCGRGDMIERDLMAPDRHRRQEAEANVFAIELLAPRPRIRRYLQGVPDIARALAMAKELDISKEAAVRRYVNCHPEQLAVVFGNDGKVIYFDKTKDFPPLAVRPGIPLPELPSYPDARDLTEMEQADPENWLSRFRGFALSTQTLFQQDVRTMTLLHVVATEDDHEDRLADTYERFRR